MKHTLELSFNTYFIIDFREKSGSQGRNIMLLDPLSMLSTEGVNKDNNTDLIGHRPHPYASVWRDNELRMV